MKDELQVTPWRSLIVHWPQLGMWSHLTARAPRGTDMPRRSREPNVAESQKATSVCLPDPEYALSSHSGPAPGPWKMISKYYLVVSASSTNSQEVSALAIRPLLLKPQN